MAELALYIGNHPDPKGYKEGDILQGFNDTHIQRVHAEHICKTTHELRRNWCDCMCEFRYERLSRTEAQIVRMSDGTTHRFESNIPFLNPFNTRNKREQMDIESYIERRKKAGKKFLDGTPGKEIWWGGRSSYGDQVCVDDIWQTIEAKTPHNRTQEKYTLWSCGKCDLCEFLFISVDNFSNHERSILESTMTDNIVAEREDSSNENIIAKRLHKVNWKDELGISGPTIDRIMNKQITIDGRVTFSYERRDVIRMKI